MFMIDLTGSMDDQVNEVKAKILDMVDAVRTKYNKATIRIGFVGYRDETNEYSFRFKIWGFDTNVQGFKEWVKDIKASK